MAITQKTHCLRCEIALEQDWEQVCRQCARSLPVSLVKALGDQTWTYEACLHSGHRIIFEGANWDGGDFVHLLGVKPDFKGVGEYERGFDVRLSEIAWCCEHGH